MGVAAFPNLVCAEIVAHHLRLFGFPAARASEDGLPFVSDRPGEREVAAVQNLLARGVLVIAVRPSEEFSRAFGVSACEEFDLTPAFFRCVFANSDRLRRASHCIRPRNTRGRCAFRLSTTFKAGRSGCINR